MILNSVTGQCYYAARTIGCVMHLVRPSVSLPVCPFVYAVLARNSKTKILEKSKLV